MVLAICGRHPYRYPVFICNAKPYVFNIHRCIDTHILSYFVLFCSVSPPVGDYVGLLTCLAWNGAGNMRTSPLWVPCIYLQRETAWAQIFYLHLYPYYVIFLCFHISMVVVRPQRESVWTCFARIFARNTWISPLWVP